ncbi:MAG: Secretion system C-terminal sorting domain, partial [Bacteroidota bacterium]|nr:Secretion system C-terminal sorting domain [Bacteroidota bacterium]
GVVPAGDGPHGYRPTSVSDYENGSKNKFSIYPNPAGDYVNIMFSASPLNPEISLYNLNGQKEKCIIESGKMDIRLLPAGLYFIVIDGKSRLLMKN